MPVPLGEWHKQKINARFFFAKGNNFLVATPSWRGQHLPLIEPFG